MRRASCGAQDYLVLAGTKASPETLHGVQELADKLSQEQGAQPRRAQDPTGGNNARSLTRRAGRGEMCIPVVAPPTTEAGACVPGAAARALAHRSC
jgi:hypothetical protein